MHGGHTLTIFKKTLTPGVRHIYRQLFVRLRHIKRFIKKMLKLVKQIRERQKFNEETLKARRKEVQQAEEDGLPPVFNKRLFITQGTAVITNEAKKIMEKNAQVPHEESHVLSKLEKSAMRCVTDGLSLVHMGYEYLKDCLSHVITFEEYNAYEYVVKRQHEDVLSCYYILHGAVEVTYDSSTRNSIQVYEPNIIYSHSSGEYLGLVTAGSEGTLCDLAPPATVYTKEHCQFLRIDRQKFHRLVQATVASLASEKIRYMNLHRCAICGLSDDEKDKLVPALHKLELSSNKLILKQGHPSEHMYFVVSGQCQAVRRIFIPEAVKRTTFQLAVLETGDICGEECAIYGRDSYCSVISQGPVVLYKLHRSELEGAGRDHLVGLLKAHEHSYPPDENLLDRGYIAARWSNFKHREVKQCLTSNGKTALLRSAGPRKVKPRPASQEDVAKEKLNEFVHGHQKSYINTIRSRQEMNRSQADDSSSFANDDDRENEFDCSPLLVATVTNYLQKDKDDDITQKPILDSRELTKRFKRSVWISSEDNPLEQIEDTITTKASSLLSLEADYIVREARDAADKYVKMVAEKRMRAKEQEESWHTIIHEELGQAKLQLAFSKYRSEVLRRKLRSSKRKENESQFFRHRKKSQATMSGDLYTKFKEELDMKKEEEEKAKLKRQNSRSSLRSRRKLIQRMQSDDSLIKSGARVGSPKSQDPLSARLVRKQTSVFQFDIEKITDIIESTRQVSPNTPRDNAYNSPSTPKAPLILKSVTFDLQKPPKKLLIT